MTELQVCHIDNHLLLVNKPAGLPVVPDDSGDESLLDRAKSFLAEEFEKPGRVFLGVVHRLDRPVSGVICFARTSKAGARLARAFRERRVRKLYRGVAERAPDEAEGLLVQWLRKDRDRNTVQAFDRRRPGTKEARTRWSVLCREDGRVLLELQPETGRPHQLRVAMASLGCPLLGDLRYGASRALPDRSIALHSRLLEVPHPTKGVPVVATAPEPALDIWRFASEPRA